MLDTSDEFVFEFENVMCTDLLLRDPKNSSTGPEQDVRESGVYLTRN